MIQSVVRRLSAAMLVVLMATTTILAQWSAGTNFYNTNGGNVGIGTGAAPTSWKLEVLGTANNLLLRNNTANSYTNLRMYGQTQSYSNSLGIVYSNPGNTTPVLTGGPSGETGSIAMIGNFPLMFGTLGTMRMTITGAGNVGIGTATANDRLEVVGSTTNNITAIATADVQTGFRATRVGTNSTDWKMYVPVGSTALRFHNATFGSDVMSLTNTGSVGIGTTNPNASYKLDVNGIINATNLYVNGQPFSTSQWTTSGSNIYYNTAGSVGIGTTTPSASYELDVNGAINATSLNVGSLNGQPFVATQWTTSGTNAFFGLTGNVGIGSSNPDAKLTVNGTVHAKEVKVDLSVPGPDYVFDKNYNLLSLEDVRAYIEKHHHLPEVPSAAEMEKNGVNVSEMNMILLKKVEELTLYVMQLEERIKKSENK